MGAGTDSEVTGEPMKLADTLRIFAGGPGSGRKPGPTSRVVEIKKKPWKKQTEEERRYIAFHDPRQQQLFKEPTVQADKDGEPMVGNMSRKHFNKTEDFFAPKPGQKGGVQAGGPGSGCKGPSCGRHSSHTSVSERKTFAGFERTYSTPVGDVTVSKFKPITRGASTSYRVRHPDGTEKVFKLGAGPNVSDKVARYVEKHFGVVDGDVTRPVEIKADGEPGVPAAGYGVIEPLGVLKHAHPPSLKNPKRVPTDDPREDDDTFGDVTKRNSKETQKMRMDMLKRSIPGGNPPALPVTTTAIPHHTAVYQPGMGFAAQKPKPKVRLKQRPAQGMVKQQPGMPEKPKRTFIPYSRRGSA